MHRPLHASAVATVLPLSWLSCLSQKHAVDEFSTPSSARCRPPSHPAGSLITGAVCLKTFPPRSSTKWLCVAHSGERDRQRRPEPLCEEHRYSNHGSPRSSCVLPSKCTRLLRSVRYRPQQLTDQESPIRLQGSQIMSAIREEHLGRSSSDQSRTSVSRSSTGASCSSQMPRARTECLDRSYMRHLRA